MKKILLLIALFIGIESKAQMVNQAKLLSDLEILASEKYEGRKTGTSGNIAAADYIIERFKGIGLSSINENYKHNFSFKNRKSEELKGTNLISYIKGKTDNIIVISAHYDHVGINNSKIFYGADDNASGVAALLHIAEYYKNKKPENTLYFVAFDAEEMGLQGAYAFLRDPKTDKKSIKLNVNMDMVSHNDKSELYAVGTYQTPILKEIIKDADKNTGINILFGHDIPGSGKDDWTMQSDQGPFAKESIPFIYFGVEDHKDYHQASDTFENINPDFFNSAANAILKSIINLDKGLQKIKANSPKP
ncbi:M20/M25/M40 family metallo-hydrolase [Daejeonella sp.]|jgi:Zn-dependent M28 family amino/carboxypeptidase|uniref:M20/M25/M40 family metallo-hydrolase n=1 Tax=Daejeonella sp. TaxID=2805397 RepID=UPI0037837DF1